MERLRNFKVFFGLLAIASALLVVSLFTLSRMSGGCFFNVKVKNFENSQNIDIEINSDICHARPGNFEIKTHEDLNLIALKGDIFVAGAEGFLVEKNTLICLDEVNQHDWRIELKRTENTNLCKPVVLSAGDVHQIERTAGPWELLTNKGSLIGTTESDPNSDDNKNIYLVSRIVFISSFIAYLAARKKLKNKMAV